MNTAQPLALAAIFLILLPAAQAAQMGKEAISRCLLPIEVTFEKSKASAVDKEQKGTLIQAGIVVGEDLVVTSCSGLLGFTELDGPSRMKLECVGVDPRLDLAVLRLKSRPADVSEPPLRPLLPAPDTDGVVEADLEDAWTLRIPLGGAGEPRAVSHAELIEEVENAKSHRDSVRLTGGLPVVDSDGHLLGIWRWTPPGEPAEILPASEIFKLVNQVKAGESVQTTLVDRPQSRVFPQLSWREDRKKPPYKHAQDQARKLAGDLECSKCHGKGHTIAKIRKKGPDGLLHQANVKVLCKSCGQSGLATSDQVWIKMRALAAASCKPDPQVQSPKQWLSLLEKRITESFQLAPDRIVKIIRDQAREALDPFKAKPGSAVSFLVSEGVWPEEQIGLWGDEVLPIEDGALRVFLVRPVARNVWEEGIDALVLGTVAGTIFWKDEHWVVIERPVAVPVRPK